MLLTARPQIHEPRMRVGEIPRNESVALDEPPEPVGPG